MAQLSQVIGDQRAGVQQQPFGDFNGNGATRHTPLGQLVCPVVGERGFPVKLNGRLVDADLESRIKPLAPSSHLVHSLRKHPITQWDDQPAGLGNGYELHRTDRPQHRVVPAQQRLSLAHLPCGHVHDGLVDHLQLLQGQRQPQIGIQPGTLLGGHLQRRREKTKPVAPRPFGRVQRLVCVLEQVFNLRGIGGVQRHPDAGRHKHRLPTQLKTLAECIQQRCQPLRQLVAHVVTCGDV